MKKYLTFLMVLLCLFTFYSCLPYEEEFIKVLSWNHIDEGEFCLGQIKIRTKYQTPRSRCCGEDKILFTIYNEKEFLEEIESNKWLLRVEEDYRGDKVYVFFYNGNYYYLSSGNDGGRIKRRGYILSNCASVIEISEEETYVFPFYNAASYFDGTFHFLKEGGDIATQKDWDYWKEFYTVIGEDYCLIDETERTIKLKACYVVRYHGKYITEDYVIRLTFWEEEEGVFYIRVRLLDND